MKIITGSLDYCVEFKHRILQALRKDSFCSILSLQGESNRAIEFVVMPNQAHPSKCVLSLRIDRTMKARLLKAAKAAKMKLADFVTYTLLREVAQTQLTSNELEQIINETRAAERKQLPDKRTTEYRSPNYPRKDRKAGEA